jgi:imidazole glycerol-phosphate synthase subunit HisF
MSIRIIPRLDIKGPNLVKGIHFEGLRVLGKPEQFARYYYDNGADELFYMDVVASLYGRNSLLDIIERTAKDVFIPLTVGGGLRSIEDIRAVLRAGADKVSLNTAVIQRPELVREAAETFGSSTIMVSIEAIRRSDGSYEAYTDYGRERSNINVVEWADLVVDLGAGELMVTSIDQEGTGQGFDLELTEKVASAVSVPVIACGGAGTRDHVYQVLSQGRADAVSLASMLHYHVAEHHRDLQADFSDEGNVVFLDCGGGFTKVSSTTLAELKTFLCDRGLDCRWDTSAEG